MDLPFAVDATDQGQQLSHHSNLHESSSTLVTASTQGSYFQQKSEHTSDLFSLNHHPNYIRGPAKPLSPTANADDAEIIDFTYVNVNEIDEDEVEIVIDAGVPPTLDEQEQPRGDILSLLLTGRSQQNPDITVVDKCAEANEAAQKALVAKQKENFTAALNYHTEAAKAFRDAAISVREEDESLSSSLLVLSQTQARSALALKRSLKQLPQSSNNGVVQSSLLSPRDRIRATVRVALASKKEADISNSIFLGKAQSHPAGDKRDTTPTGQSTNHNPVDEMMELERELRDMDMELKLGNSVASLGPRSHNTRSKPLEDGSFMVVPPGAANYASSSALWASGNVVNPPRQAQMAPARAKANRVQNILEGASATGGAMISPPPTGLPRTPSTGSGLESSWWGNQSTASHMLASSVASLGSGRHHDMGTGDQPASTKQVMRLMDALKTLGDENAILMREAEGAEEARAEAKAIKEQMARFKEDYRRRFASLKAALEKFRKGYPESAPGSTNPVSSSEFIKFASTSEQLQRQEQLIRKLTADLKREKDESKKKDAALRKYESFYREVKARSAQKAAQRQKEAAQQRQGPSRKSKSQK